MYDFELLFKICLFGDKEVGKISIAKNINPIFFSDLSTINTVGVAFVSKDIETSGKRIRLSIYLISDKKTNQKMWYSFANGSNGFILMYNITNANSLNYLSDVLQVLKDLREKVNNPILLVGNKLDLEEQREISNEQIEQFKEEHDIPESMEISSKTGENVEQMLLQLSKMIITKGE